MSRSKQSTGTLKESIYRIVRSKILTEEYPQGCKISENTLAREYGCSRTPIREILTWLRNDGLVVIVPKSGTYVRVETKRDMLELTQIRSYLESLAYRLAVESETESYANRMKQLLDEMDQIVEDSPIDVLGFASLHYEFHFQLIQASGNEWLKKMYERLNLRSSHMFYRVMDHDGAGRTQSEHRAIVDLVSKRSREGERFVREHLFEATRRATEAPRSGP